MMDYFENKINREVLPYLRGYKKAWKFEYLKDIELDDEQKIAAIYSTKASTVSTYISMNFPIELALKFAGIGDDLATGDVESIKDSINAAQMAMLQEQVSGVAGTDVMAGNENDDMGRYGDDQGSYMPINVSDYGQGGENTETRTGEKAEQEFKGGAAAKAKKKPAEKGTVKKAKVYINHPSEAPKGRSVRRGGRGGYYYITADTGGKSSTASMQARSGAARHGSPKGWQAQKQQDGGGAPAMGGGGGGGGAPPQVAENQVTITGENVGLVIAVVNGEIVAEALPTEETTEFISTVAQQFDPTKDVDKFMQGLLAEAEQRGYEIQ
jgi:hypothetical protein